MKKLIIVFVILLATFQISTSQPYQTVYTARYFIDYFYSFEFANIPAKKIFFKEFGITGTPCPPDTIGFFIFQINKNNFQIYRPFNGFLDRFECTLWPSGCDRHSVDFFTISYLDSNLIIKYMNYAGAPSPNCSPFIRSHITTNGGFGSSLIFNNQVLHGCDIDPSNTNTIYAGVDDHIYKSINKGNTWSIASTITDLNGIVRVNPLRTNDVFAAGTSNMYLSTNGGINFSTLSAPPFRKIVFNLNDSSIYAVTNTAVYKSFNHGLNWSHIFSFTYIYTIEIDPDNPDIIYIGTTDKVFRSLNGGQTFNHSNLSLPNSNNIIGISKDASSGDTIYLCTDKGIFKVWDLQTDIKNITSILPEKYKLYQNYPNPFNPSTTIRFDIPQSSYVKITIFDLLGKEITSLVNRKLKSGSYEVYWSNGVQPSGIYFYRFDAGDFTTVKKMMILK